MSKNRGSWNTDDTQPIKRVRLEDTRPMKAVKMESTFHWLLRCLLGLFLIAALVLFVLYLVSPSSMSKIPIFADLANTLSTGPSDEEAVQLLQAKFGGMFSDIQFSSKVQCPISAQTKAEGITDAFRVYFRYKHLGYQESSNILLVRTEQNQRWAASDWYIKCD